MKRLIIGLLACSLLSCERPIPEGGQSPEGIKDHFILPDDTEVTVLCHRGNLLYVSYRPGAESAGGIAVIPNYFDCRERSER